jgi:hypothetical protein
LISAEIRKRETLYGQFIGECSKLLIDSIERTLDRPQTLVSAYELINRIRLCASDAVLVQADEVLRRITEQYFSPNLSVEEIRALTRSRSADPLKPFGDACRVELQAMYALF